MLIRRIKFQFSATPTCLYKMLNISTDASFEQIKMSYFEMAKKYHPDSNPNTAVDPEKFRQIQEAYQILSNVEKRKQYDKENNIISQAYYGDPGFGESDKVYEKFAGMNKESIYEKKESTLIFCSKQIEEFTEYFDKQYFNNKDFFKRKVDSESHWNMSEKLFRQHQKIEEKKSEYVLLHPFQTTYYWERKDDLKITKSQAYMMLLYDLRYLFVLIGLGTGSYYAAQYFEKQNKGKQQISKADVLQEGPGYKLKILPLNIS